MEHHPDNMRLADSAELQQALNQLAAESEETRKQLQAANHRLQRQVAQQAAQLQTVVAELSYAEQRERHRLAQLLHDNLQQLLTRAKHSAHQLRHAVERGERDLHLNQVGNLLDQSVAKLRSFTIQATPPVLYKGSMTEIIQWLAASLWTEHDFAVHVDADGSASPQAEEVRVLLFHVVRELLDNVRKHAGTRTARVTLAQSDPEAVQITVSDTGMGFDPAVRLAHGRFGTGLSLSTLRRRMELLGGRMDIHSAPGQGTQVTVVAPTQLTRAASAPVSLPPIAKTQAQVPAASPARDSSVCRIRVLLADDHAVVRDSLANLLQEQPDMDVVGTAANGLQAVDMALALKPEVIVMDANMPLLSGVQAARRILAHLPTAKVIALSMYSVADMDLAMRQAGACEYLTKESAPDDLVATIRKHAGKPARR
jgi:signal transduction histidine kinase/CheY-like chemotaxis protein